MSKKIYLPFCFFLGLFDNLNSQQLIPRVDLDSLKSTHSISGKLSTIDLSSGYALTSLGFASNQPFLYDPLQLLYSGLPFNALESTNILRYTSLPHLGFVYTFGSSAFQFAKFQYSQAFAKNWIVNLDYINQQTTGVLRNSSVKNQLVTIKAFKKSKNLESILTADFSLRSYGWNGGIINDSLPLSYAPELIPVNKSNALSTRREVLLNWSNYIDLHKDSNERSGIYCRSNFHSRNRRFLESGDLISQYSQIYVDSFETNDHLQISSIANGIGFFTTKSKWSLTFGVLQNFWNYRNGLFYRDTLELDIDESFIYKARNFSLNQKFDFNIIGRGRSWKNEFAILKRWGKTIFKMDWKIENSFPELFQRHYFSNNIKYQLSIYERQLKNKVEIAYTLPLKNNLLTLKAAHIYLKNPYFFIGNTWSNSQITNVNSFNASISYDLKYKLFTFSPSYSFYSLPTVWRIYPSHLFRMRMIVERGVLKKRKLSGYLGVEPHFIGGFIPFEIYPSMDLFRNADAILIQRAFLDLSVFAGIELKAFKFFARAENLGYFWNNRMLQLAKGYPIPPMQIQLGISWDFWN